MPGSTPASYVQGARALSVAARLAMLGALLLTEGGVVAAGFDALPIVAPGDAWWAPLLGRLGFVVPLGAAVLTTTLLLGAGALGAPAARAPRRGLWLLVLAHAGAFGLVLGSSAAVFDPARAGSTGWAALWTFAVVGTVATAIAVLVPRDTWGAVRRAAVTVLVPCAAVGAVAWAAGRVTSNWWHPLGHLTLDVVAWVLGLVTRDVVVVPESFVVGTPTFQVEIAKECAGYEGVGLMWVTLAAYLWVFRTTLRFPQALLLLPIGTVAIWLANAARIAGLVGIGTWLSPAVALGGFHAQAGSLVFCCMALALAWGARRCAWFSIVDERASAGAAASAASAGLAPLLALTLTAMVTGSLGAAGFDPLYGLRVAVAVVLLATFREAYRGLGWHASWAGLVLGAAGFALWMLLPPAVSDDGATAAALDALPASMRAAWIACRLAGAVVVVPVVEEIAFRGYLARRLDARDVASVPLARISPRAVVVSSLLFGLLHDRVLAGTAAGMLYAVAARRRGALGDAVLAHATTNALLAAYALTTGSWGII